MKEIKRKKCKYKFGNKEYDLYSRTYIMGIINVTPDSFSDGGKFVNSDHAVESALTMVEQGADFIDIGGESTRPGSERIPAHEEMKRVIPVIEKLVKYSDVPISVDTYKSEVADESLKTGAKIVNDISGLHFDENMAEVIARHGASVVIMHIRGTPKTMQNNIIYNNLLGEIFSYLKEGIKKAVNKGINQIIIDPGIGFGKNLDHNLEIFYRLKEFHELGYPLLVGPSKKTFIGKILNLPVNERMEGTAAAVSVSIMNGANIIRVHDVREMKRVASIVDAILKVQDSINIQEMSHKYI